MNSWRSKEVQGWLQDVTGWTDPETEQYYPPTFSWAAQIFGQRTKDDVNFYLNLRVHGEDGKPLNLKAAAVALEAGLIEFEEFADCACTLEKPCDKHSHRSGRL